METSIYSSRAFARKPLERKAERPAESLAKSCDSVPGRIGKRVVFLGAASGAGTSSIAMSFAEYCFVKLNAKKGGKAQAKKTVSYIEISGGDSAARSGYEYDRIGCDSRFAGRHFRSPYDVMAAGQSVRDLNNPDSGVNWLLRSPYDETRSYPFDEGECHHLIGSTPGDLRIIDVKNEDLWLEAGPASERILANIVSDSDLSVLVVDPLPSKLLAGSAMIELMINLERSSFPVLVIINKMNKGVNARELRSFLGVKRFLEIPALPPELIYRAEYNCCTLYGAGAGDALENVLAELFVMIS